MSFVDLDTMILDKTFLKNNLIQYAPTLKQVKFLIKSSKNDIIIKFKKISKMYKVKNLIKNTKNNTIMKFKKISKICKVIL